MKYGDLVNINGKEVLYVEGDDCEGCVFSEAGSCPDCEEGKFVRLPNPWHTGTPTEDGLYWVAVRFSFSNDIIKPFAETIRYGATPFNNGSWNLELPYVVVAWQKIIPYEESEEEHIEASYRQVKQE